MHQRRENGLLVEWGRWDREANEVDLRVVSVIVCGVANVQLRGGEDARYFPTSFVREQAGEVKNVEKAGGKRARQESSGRNDPRLREKYRAGATVTTRKVFKPRQK